MRKDIRPSYRAHDANLFVDFVINDYRSYTSESKRIALNSSKETRPSTFVSII